MWVAIWDFADICTCRSLALVSHDFAHLLQGRLFRRVARIDPGRVWSSATACGNLEIVRWLHQNDVKGHTPEDMEGAVLGCHYDVVEFLHQHRSEGCTPDAMMYASIFWTDERLKWFVLKYTYLSGVAMDFGARRVDMLEWLHQNGTGRPSEHALWEAARSGKLESVRWLWANFPSIRYDGPMIAAARGGHLHIIKWISTVVTPSVETLWEILHHTQLRGNTQIMDWVKDRLGVGVVRVDLD